MFSALIVDTANIKRITSSFVTECRSVRRDATV